MVAGVTQPSTAPAYPAAPRLDLVDDFHGTPVPDPYRWLESADDPRTTDWLAGQAAPDGRRAIRVDPP